MISTFVFHFYWVGEEWFKASTITKILLQFFLFTICCTQNSFVNVFQFGLDRLWVSSWEFIHDIFQSKVSIFVFDEVNAIESTSVAVLGMNSNCVELVLRSVGNQHVSEATVIRFRCSSERIEKFGGSFLWEIKCVPSRSQESVLTTKFWARLYTRAGSWSAQHTVAGRSLR
jgi:hypothetical protein